MQNNAGTIAESYYKEMAKKNSDGIAQYVAPNMELIGPLSKKKGKEEVLSAAKGFMDVFESLVIRAVTSSDNNAVIIFDLNCPQPIGTIPSAAFMTIENGLITRSELFYDPRALIKG